MKTKTIKQLERIYECGTANNTACDDYFAQLEYWYFYSSTPERSLKDGFMQMRVADRKNFIIYLVKLMSYQGGMFNDYKRMIEICLS